ncbi:protein-disulfide reductase DsbD N-terminal domain-containing protein [uncultured Cytophaga sp.]|uniref:protein-disulfide reductase DsbD N-terminal domain-containing protein n=1 Tax=uncultured Cytophaga sp. TaxID=160238 RepID=UPI0026258AB1|nr:protein-disulfide reductase DsbD N-terminal domain-containing protein [uncultured Cytophaga sp.]
MKRILILSFCLLSGLVQAQNTDPIKWSFALSSKEIHVGDTVEIVASATIIPDWYLYSNDFDKDLGPSLTQFDFEEQVGYRLLAKPKAINPKKKYDKIWEGDVTYFVGHAEFRQKIVVTSVQPKISFTVNFQTCSDAAGRCIPGEVDFEFFNPTILPAKKNTKAQVEKGSGVQSTSEQTVVETKHSETNAKKTSSLKELEEQKKLLTQQDSKGNDVSVGYLKNFVKKYSK